MAKARHYYCLRNKLIHELQPSKPQLPTSRTIARRYNRKTVQKVLNILFKLKFTA